MMAFRSFLLSAAALAAQARAIDIDSLSMVQGIVRHHTVSDVGACSRLHADDRLEPEIAAKSELVVVRSVGEDVRWLNALPEIPAVIYNHNGLDELLPRPRSNLRIVKQPNRTTQDSTMIMHVIEHYANLADLTVFLSGWPFRPCANAIQEVRRALRNAENVTDPAVAKNGAERGLVPVAATFYQYSLKEGMVGSWYDLVRDQRQRLGTNTHGAAAKDAGRSYGLVCQKILGTPCPSTLWVSEGGQWVVSSERIRSQPLDFYQRIQNLEVGGDLLQQKHIRGFVLEGIWPVIWGSTDWAPGQAVKEMKGRKGVSALGSVDAVKNYCLFTTEPRSTSSVLAKRGICELKQLALSRRPAAESSHWDAETRLQVVPHHKISKEMVLTQKAGSEVFDLNQNDDPAPLCSKRHFTPFTTATRIRNTKSGQCVQHSSTGFVMAPCRVSEDKQSLNLLSSQNDGYVQIQDNTATACFAYDFYKMGKASKCESNPDGSATDKQKWELLSQGGGKYHIKMRGIAYCMGVQNGEMFMGPCDSNEYLWELADVASSGQYVERFEYALVKFADGKLKMRCSLRLHSDDENPNPDLVEPLWRKRGRLASFVLQDAPDGGHYIMDRTAFPERFLNCNKTSREVVLTEAKTSWKFKPVSGSFVLLQASRQVVMQFHATTGVLKCGLLERDGSPPEDTTFALDFW